MMWYDIIQIEQSYNDKGDQFVYAKTMTLIYNKNNQYVLHL